MTKKRPLLPLTKIPFQNNCQKPVFRTDIKYSSKYSFALSGTTFCRARTNRYNIRGESAETRLLRAKVTEEHIPKNSCFPQWQTYLFRQPVSTQFLNAENHITKNKRLYGLVILYCRHRFFMTAGILLFCLSIWLKQIES